MARPNADEDEEKPLDPAVENVRRKLVRFAVINLGILLVALMAVVLAVVYKTRGTPDAPSAAPAGVVPSGEPVAGDIVLPAGASILSQALSGNRLTLDLRLADGSRSIFLYDLAERRIVGRFAIRFE